MAASHKAFFWTAPTKNTDGTPITYPLDYTFYANKVGDAPQAILTTPGALNPDGRYTAPIADMPFFQFGNTYETRLQAVNHNKPTEVSAQSNAVTFAYDSVENPEAPLDLAVA